MRTKRVHGGVQVALESCESDMDPLRRAILSGLFMHAAILLPDSMCPVFPHEKQISTVFAFPSIHQQGLFLGDMPSS